MEQPFYIGQEVVALKSLTNAHGIKLIKGKEYVVKGMVICSCGLWMIDVGIISNEYGYTGCKSCCRVVIPKTKICYVRSCLLAPVSRLRISDELTIAADLLKDAEPEVLDYEPKKTEDTTKKPSPINRNPIYDLA